MCSCIVCCKISNRSKTCTSRLRRFAWRGWTYTMICAGSWAMVSPVRQQLLRNPDAATHDGRRICVITDGDEIQHRVCHGALGSYATMSRAWQKRSLGSWWAERSASGLGQNWYALADVCGRRLAHHRVPLRRQLATRLTTKMARPRMSNQNLRPRRPTIARLTATMRRAWLSSNSANWSLQTWGRT